MCLGLYCPAKSFLFNLFCNTNCSGHVATELLSPFRFLISRSFRPFRCWKIWKRIIDLRGRWTVLVNVHFLAVLSNVFLWQFYVQHLFSIYYSSNVWRAESIPVEKHAPWKVQILNRIKPKVTYKHYKLSLLSTSSQKVFANLQHVGISNTICIAGFERSWILIGSQLSRLTPTKDTNWESNSLGVCQIADDVGTFFAIHAPVNRLIGAVNQSTWWTWTTVISERHRGVVLKLLIALYHSLVCTQLCLLYFPKAELLITVGLRLCCWAMLLRRRFCLRTHHFTWTTF